MNIPNLPTDNLYKFIALTGVLLLLISIFYPEYQRIKIRDEITHYNGEIKKLNIESNKSNSKLKDIKEQVEKLDSISNTKSNSIVNDTIIVRTQVLEGPKVLVDLSLQIDKLVDEYLSIRRDLSIQKVEVNTKLNLINDKEADLKDINELTNYLGGFSIVLSFLGFLLWYEKTQKYQDRVLKEQSNQYLHDVICQSCGMKLSDEPDSFRLVEKELNIKYCKTCFKDGQFTEPELTLDQMKQKIENRCTELGYGKLKTSVYSSNLENLDRWKLKFNWK